jgi:hypothetical protein
MRKVIFLAVLGILAGCSAKPSTVISYSDAFNLSLPTSTLSEATFFSADGLSVGWSDQKLISGLIVTRELESLPSNFDLKDYPRYLLKLKDTSGLSPEVAEIFNNSANEFDYSFGLENVTERTTDSLKIYSACREDRCTAFVLKEGVNDHILSMYTQKISEQEFNDLLEGF